MLVHSFHIWLPKKHVCFSLSVTMARIQSFSHWFFFVETGWNWIMFQFLFSTCLNVSDTQIISEESSTVTFLTIIYITFTVFIFLNPDFPSWFYDHSFSIYVMHTLWNQCPLVSDALRFHSCSFTPSVTTPTWMNTLVLEPPLQCSGFWHLQSIWFHVFELWEETWAHNGNPCRYWKNMQILQIKYPDNPNFFLWGNSAIYKTNFSPITFCSCLIMMVNKYKVKKILALFKIRLFDQMKK